MVDVLEEEATEDVQRMFGAGAEERLNSPWFFSFRKLIGWLLVNLVTAFLAASVVAIFEGTIRQWATLAVFMPVVAGSGGKAPGPTLHVIVRGSDLVGIAVHAAARICALAEPGRILVSDTVRMLLLGFPFELEDAGEHVLKGVPDRWRLRYCVHGPDVPASRPH